MPIAFVAGDIPVLKQLSYKLTDEIDNRLAGHRLSNGQSITKLGVSRLQNMIAQSLDYKDWGHLQATSKHSNKNRAVSGLDRLCGEAVLNDFAGKLYVYLIQYFTGELEGCDQSLFIRSYLPIEHLYQELNDILKALHVPSVIQIHQGRNLLVIGDVGDRVQSYTDSVESVLTTGGVAVVIVNSDEDDFLESFALLKQAQFVLSTDLMTNSVPVDAGNLLAVKVNSKGWVSAVMAICNTIAEIRSSKSSQVVNFILPNIDLIENQDEIDGLTMLMQQGRAFGISLTLSMNKPLDSRLEHAALSNSIDIILGENADSKYQRKLSAPSKKGMLSLVTGFGSGVFRYFRKR